MSGLYGADVSQPTSVAQWQQAMSQIGATFGIVEVYQSTGNVAPGAATSINAGWAAGMTRMDAYHFPSLSVSPQEQIAQVVQALSAANVRIGYYWIDVEQPDPPIWSTTTFASNAQFLTQLI